jgi:hypothetical protein
MLFKAQITIYTENHPKSINTNVEFLTLIAAGTYRYHSALKVLRHKSMENVNAMKFRVVMCGL